MGQAKRRGTREERIQQAQARTQLRKDMDTLTKADYHGAGAVLTLVAAALAAQQGRTRPGGQA